MIPIRIPVNDIQKFQNAKLGTLWKHHRGPIAKLRRKTHPKTLEGTLFLLTLRKSKVLFKIDPEEWAPTEDNDTITDEWLLSIGFLEDGNGNQEYASPTTPPTTPPENSMQLLVSVPEQSCWIETYDDHGVSLALIEVPGGSKKQVLHLCSALGINTRPTSPTKT